MNACSRAPCFTESHAEYTMTYTHDTDWTVSGPTTNIHSTSLCSIHLMRNFGKASARVHTHTHTLTHTVSGVCPTVGGMLHITDTRDVGVARSTACAIRLQVSGIVYYRHSRYGCSTVNGVCNTVVSVRYCILQIQCEVLYRYSVRYCNLQIQCEVLYLTDTRGMGVA